MSKQYVNGVFLREKVFPDGGSVINASIKVEDFVAALYANASADGFAHFCIGKRREVGSNGLSHSMWVDEWRKNRPSQQTAKPEPQENGTETPF